MTVINEPTSHNINEQVGNSDTLMMEKIMTQEKVIPFKAKYKELDDEDSFCFVLGYN